MNKTDFVKELELVAYSCHKKTDNAIKGILKNRNILTFQYLEYFFDYPIVRNELAQNKKNTIVNSRTVYLPFIKRLIDSAYYLPKYDKTENKITLLNKTKSIVCEKQKLSRLPLKLSHLPIAPNVVTKWLSGDSPDDINNTGYFFENKIYSTLASLYELHSVDSNELFHFSYEMNIARYLLTDISDTNALCAIKYPICSDNVLYGYFILHFQLNTSTNEELVKIFEEMRSCLYSKLRDIVKTTYFPTLLLFHATQYEKLLINKVDNDNETTCEPISKYQLFFNQLRLLENNKNILEVAFASRFETPKSKEFYLFAKYNIVSPVMMKLIETIAESAKVMSKPQEGDSLPSALIYGEAGSGKDILAKLIPQFTKDYQTSEVETINMAALKPNALAIPNLMGFALNNIIDIDGLLKQNSAGKVIIFDELNSLDYDLQGALLRVLENGEVQKLFGSKISVVDMIIGIINEDPEHISREKEIDLLSSSESLLGKILNTYLKEGIIKSRRLRPDLMYRLMRGIYLRLPSLKQRREDIPMLFYISVNKALNSLEVTKKLDFELSAIDLLMNEAFEWQGNVRQLQKIAKDVAILLKQRNNSEEEFILTEEIVKECLEVAFNKVL